MTTSTPNLGNLTFWPIIGPCKRDPSKKVFLWPDPADTTDPNVFTLRVEKGGEKMGHLIATVVINPEFDAETVNRFRWLLSMVPEMWQTLFELAQFTRDTEAKPILMDAFAVLWETAGFNPMETPDGERRWEVNARALAALEPGEPIPTIIQKGAR